MSYLDLLKQLDEKNLGGRDDWKSEKRLRWEESMMEELDEIEEDE